MAIHLQKPVLTACYNRQLNNQGNLFFKHFYKASSSTAGTPGGSATSYSASIPFEAKNILLKNIAININPYFYFNGTNLFPIALPSLALISYVKVRLGFCDRALPDSAEYADFMNHSDITIKDDVYPSVPKDQVINYDNNYSFRTNVHYINSQITFQIYNAGMDITNYISMIMGLLGVSWTLTCLYIECTMDLAMEILD